jgi:hypothetical protein
MHVHDVIYANNLSLNNDITMRPATQEHPFIGGDAKQRLPFIGFSISATLPMTCSTTTVRGLPLSGLLGLSSL